jgi:hypothetical protein
VEIQSLRADIESLTMQARMHVEQLEKLKSDVWERCFVLRALSSFVFVFVVV